MKNKNCTNLGELVKVEINVIQKHIDDHKWFNHIPEKNDGMVDFIQKYMFLVREVYCGYTCPKRYECAIAEQYLPKESTKTIA